VSQAVDVGAVPLQLLRDGEECLQRARTGIEAGTDRIIVAQDLRDAGESLIAAADELALHERRRRLLPLGLAARRRRGDQP
jgi:hypothetical protein